MYAEQKNIQVSLVHFTDDENQEYRDLSDVRLFIQSFWLKSEQLLIPYIATMNEHEEIIKPYRIPVNRLFGTCRNVGNQLGTHRTAAIRYDRFRIAVSTSAIHH